MIKLNLLQIGILSILIFDIIGSLSSRWIGFNYQYLTPLSFLIYCTISFLATIGWLVSILLEANTGDINIQPYSVNFFVMMVFSMIIIASIMGLIGGGIALLTKKKPVNIQDQNTSMYD
ncbi:hypothetical protein [Pedobacter heparinus]|uniref:hypothetical protein n=1 Tax=Pedobacter heparinus TaxID=984 RepID=UPI002930F8E9|nr:hypothetical protein [Pedobacter heparinus]